MCDKINQNGNDFFNSIQFTNEDIKEVFGKDIEFLDKYELSGLILFSSCIIHKHKYKNSLRGGSFSDCFQEVTGIAEGIALFSGGLDLMTKGGVKRAIKFALKKVGSRVIGGLGLALMAAEMAYCMY